MSCYILSLKIKMMINGHELIGIFEIQAFAIARFEYHRYIMGSSRAGIDSIS